MGPLSLAFDPFTKGTIYAATQTVLQVSADDGLTWAAMGRPDTAYAPQYILADPLHRGTLYATSVGGVFRSLDSGVSWSRVGTDANAGPMAADAASGAIYFWVNGTVFKSSDGLATRVAVGPQSLLQGQALAVAGSSLYLGAATTSDVFVTKLDPLGNVIYSTYFGGSGSDVAHGIAVDASGAAYVTGVTTSVDFPVTASAFAKNGGSFLFKLNPDGTTSYSTYFSDARSQPNAVAVDSSGHAYIAGTTKGGLPVTPGVYQSTLAAYFNPLRFALQQPPINGFIAEFSADGGSLVYSTYFGIQDVTASALALAPDGTAIIAGGSSVYRMYAGGLSLVDTATVAGAVYALAIDGAGNVYAAGGTGSRLFTGTPGAFQTTALAVPAYPGASGARPGDGFLAKFDSQLRLISSTLVGGEAPDQAQAVALASNGNVILAGTTYSKAFPMRGAAQSAFAPSTSFVSELMPDLSSLKAATYAGDARTFSIFSAAPMPDGGAVFVGSTLGPISQGPYASFDPTIPNNSQALAARVAITPSPGLRIDSVENAASRLGVALSPGETFVVNGAGFGADAALTINGIALPLISRSASTLTAAVPMELSSVLPTAPMEFGSPVGLTATVQSGGSSASIAVPFTGGAPGVFSVDGSGLGQAYVLNADGTLNSPANPASEGSKITVLATGVGPLTFDGPYAVTNSPVEVLVDGFLAPGIAARYGAVAGFPGNVYQISVYVPQPSAYLSIDRDYRNFHLPSQSALILVVNPEADLSGVLGLRSQAGVGISIAH
jgi:uncharacterized protein (TIGR03437 family)